MVWILLIVPIRSRLFTVDVKQQIKLQNKQNPFSQTCRGTKGCNGGWFSGLFFRIFEIILFWFVVAISDLVHDVEAIVHLP